MQAGIGMKMKDVSRDWHEYRGFMRDLPWRWRRHPGIGMKMEDASWNWHEYRGFMLDLAWKWGIGWN